MKKIILAISVFLVILGCSGTKLSRAHIFFSSNEIHLIKDADSSTPMRIYKITNKEDSLLLRTKSGYIKPDANNAMLQTFVKRLYATVRDSLSMGVGIAAPQVGVLKNIIWVQRFDKEGFPFEVYLNPKIVTYSKDKQTVKEGCLSIPNRSETLYSRSQSIAIVYDTMEETRKSDTIEGFTSVIFQHEIDHLNGILYLDHLEKELGDAKPKSPKSN